MKEERTAQLEQKIGFVVLLLLLFISLIVMTAYEILSTFLMIIL
ncbi:hypothetical protein [Bacillus swezeyi]|nr:hypothetical protein [Bacillus swezeyi]